MSKGPQNGFEAIHNRLRAAAADAQPPMPRAPRPVVILGAGGIVEAAHLPAYAKAGFPVVSLADLQPGRAAALAAQSGIAHSYLSVAEAIAAAPARAVFDVAVPAPQLLTVLSHLPAGATVLLQKPMGETLDEARAIRDLCRERGLVAAVNFQLRYAPNHLAVRALAAAGALGDAHEMEVQVRTYTPWQLWTFLAQAPRLEILYHSIHYLDLARCWFGEPLGIRASTTKNPQTPSLAATRSAMLLDYGESKRVTVLTNHGHSFLDSQCSYVQWEGTAGVVRMTMGVNLDYPDGRPDTLRYALREDPAGWQDVPIAGNWFPDAFCGSMGALQAFTEGSIPELPTSVESAYRTMALVEAAYRASDAAPEPVPS